MQSKLSFIIYVAFPVEVEPITFCLHNTLQRYNLSKLLQRLAVPHEIWATICRSNFNIEVQENVLNFYEQLGRMVDKSSGIMKITVSHKKLIPAFELFILFYYSR